MTQSLKKIGMGHAFFWSTLDLLAAYCMMLALAFVIPLGLESVNWLVMLGGGERVVDVAGILADLQQTPFKTELLWIYAMLFSTLIPSFVNLSFALTAALFSRQSKIKTVLSSMPEDHAEAVSAFTAFPPQRRRIERFFQYHWLTTFGGFSLAVIFLGGVCLHYVPNLADGMLLLAHLAIKGFY